MNTKYKILLCATNLFLEKGYTNTYVTNITKALKISTGNLTFHFPTKEHILSELLTELNAFQRQTEKDQEDYSLIKSYLLEFAMFFSICEENPNIRDLAVAVYTHPLSLKILRENDTQRAMRVFREFCPDWTEIEFIQAENVVSGIEYSLFRTENTQLLSHEQIVTSVMDSIMKIYEIPEDIRQSIISEVMGVDYRSKGRRVFADFANHVREIYLDK